MKIKIYTTDKNGTATISKDEATSDSITINADNLTNKLKQHEYYI
jgi:hypothetical protein